MSQVADPTGGKGKCHTEHFLCRPPNPQTEPVTEE